MQKAKAATFRAFHYSTVASAALTMGSLGAFVCFGYGMAVADPITSYGFATLGGTISGIGAAAFASLPFQDKR